MPEFTPQEIDEYRLQREIERLIRYERATGTQARQQVSASCGPPVQKSRDDFVSLQVETGGHGFIRRKHLDLH